MFSSTHQLLCGSVQVDCSGQPIAYGLPEPASASRSRALRRLLDRFRREEREQKRQEREAERARSLQHTGQAGHPVA